MRRLLTTMLVIGLFFSLCAFVAAQDDDDVIRIDTNLVLINATVTNNKGQYLANLKAEDFLIEEDGARRQIAHFAAESTPFAAAILIDASGSMKTKLSRARIAAAHFSENLRSDDVCAVYSFNSEVDRLQDFATANEMMPDVWDVEAKGLTRLYDALFDALSALEKRGEQRRAIILISDGGDTNSNHTDSQVMALALRVGATIYSIDLADNAAVRDLNSLQGSGYLKAFAEKTGGQYIRTPGGQQLNEHLLAVSNELRSQYTIGFYADKKNGQFHRLTLKVPTHTEAQIRARQGYYQLKEDKTKDKKN